MEVKLATEMGFCYGIRRTIKLAEDNPNAICIGGEITRSPMEPERLKREFGIISTLDHTSIKPNQTAIIIPHGVPERTEQYLRNKNVKVIDATCPNVKKVQLKIKELDAQGYKIILLGNSINHPEVRGHLGYGKNIIFVRNASELPKIKADKVAIISQTTENESDLLEIHKKLPKAKLFNTICDATRRKHKACEDLSQEVDIMIVVGGKNSNNSCLLQEVASKHCSAYLVETADDINSQWFIGKSVCGLTAGATTPDYAIQAIKNYIESI